MAWSEWVNNTFRKICEGMKVAAQCVALATDKGRVAEGEAVLAVAGTGPINFPEGGGADTALVMTAGPSSEYAEDYAVPAKPYRRRIRQIICKPY